MIGSPPYMLRKKKSNAMTEPNATATEPTIQTSNDTFKGIETQQLTTKESISKSNSGETTQYENTNVATTSATASTDVTNSDSNVQQQHPSYSQQQQQQQHKSKSLHESNLHKIASRAVTATALFSIFYTSVSMGHVYISALVALIELLLFRELVRVRYNAHFDKIQNKIPLFRTTQWCWFAVSIFYTYSDFCIDMMQRNEQWHVWLRRFFHYVPTMTFWMYAVTFVLTIKTLQTGHIKFQMNQLCWTIVVICVTVGQLKYIFHNIFNGLIWFVLPCCLVFCNDIMAYVTGMLCGRKFIQRPFIAFSPNKTWEGFLGGWIFTMICGWYLSRYLSQYTWMTCPVHEFRLHPTQLQCELDPIFLRAQSYFPSQIFELFPRSIVKMLPGVVEICSVKEVDGLLLHVLASDLAEPVLAPCVSGKANQQFHHFELTLKNFYLIQMHALWLALFASLVAPFGGFLASAMKRAYGIKDFDSIIPGHGGVMDRMDCQFLMSLYTWVHYNAFVKLATVSVPRLTWMYSLLTDQEKEEFLNAISTSSNKGASFADYGFY